MSEEEKMFKKAFDNEEARNIFKKVFKKPIEEYSNVEIAMLWMDLALKILDTIHEAMQLSDVDENFDIENALTSKEKIMEFVDNPQNLQMMMRISEAKAVRHALGKPIYKMAQCARAIHNEMYERGRDMFNNKGDCDE